MALLDFNSMHSRAVTPLRPEKPNVRLIVFFCRLSFLIFFVSTTLVQMVQKKVFVLSQLENLALTQNKYLFGKALRSSSLNESKTSGRSLFSIGFVEEFLNAGKIGCVVDISQKKRR